MVEMGEKQKRQELALALYQTPRNRAAMGSGAESDMGVDDVMQALNTR